MASTTFTVPVTPISPGAALKGLFGAALTPEHLPAGLVFHCESCRIAIPADAPKPDHPGDCAPLAAIRMCPFKPDETTVGQFTMAAAAWGLIHHATLKANTHAASTDYHHRFRKQRRQHFAASAVRQAMTPAQIAKDSVFKNGRSDAWLFKAEK